MPDGETVVPLCGEDAAYMREALAEAEKAAAAGEVPVGAVIVLGGRILARSHNHPIGLNDPTAHAELLAIRAAGQIVGNYRLLETTLYTTLEPCLMCAGAMVHARIRRLVFGAPDLKGGAVVSCGRVFTDCRSNHVIEFVGGVLEDRCTEILSSFFKQKRL